MPGNLEHPQLALFRNARSGLKKAVRGVGLFPLAVDETPMYISVIEVGSGLEVVQL